MILLTPTTPQTAFDDRDQPPANIGDFTALSSIAQLPAITLPVGSDQLGLPIGLQIMSAAWRDRELLAFASEAWDIIRDCVDHENEKLGGRLSFNAERASR